MLNPETWLNPTGNSLAHLSVVVAIIVVGVGARMLAKHAAFMRRRRRIPLVIGGWGTRGKSGTERKKAALCSALGARFVSKTTGCEAMFIGAFDIEEPKEYVLFRPHGKASIWEQTDVVSLADTMKCDVFLWECMGLQADYTRILQHCWMRDDVSTITNAYPDHEDIQGPSGRDVATSIANFTRPRGTVISAEDSMHPVFHDLALARRAKLSQVDVLEADLICPDVLARYPYQAHPRNLVLVSELGRRLGVTANFTLKEVADHIIPDLGVLKTYPEVEVRGRRLRFSNGMSANERAGTLHNWRRLGLEDPNRDRHEWVVTVINNRADRVPRSRVFADLVVGDLSAHRHVAIGSNLAGLRRFIVEALDKRLARMSVPSEGGVDYVTETLGRDAARLRSVPRTVEELSVALAGTLEIPARDIESTLTAGVTDIEAALADALDAASDEAAAGAREIIARHTSFGEHERALADAVSRGDAASLEAWLARHKEWYRERFMASLVFVEDFHISGPDLIREIAGAVPIGTRAQLVGLQNIKGTGQNFAERWVRVGDLERALRRLAVADPLQAQQAFRTVSRFPDIEDFEAALIRQRLDEMGSAVDGEIRQKLLETLPDEDESTESRNRGGSESSWKKRLFGAVESVLDPFDSMRRSRLARIVSRDLANERISMQHARRLLKEISGRQKGGWLG